MRKKADDATAEPGNEGEWIPKQEAAARLGISIRQIENLTSKGRIRKRKMPKASWEKTGRVVYAAQDIDRIRQGGDAARTAAPGETTALAPVAPAVADPFAGLPQKLAALAAAFPPPGKTWLSLKEASAHSGLPARWLREAARAGKLRAQNVGAKRERWMFPREGLN